MEHVKNADKFTGVNRSVYNGFHRAYQVSCDQTVEVAFSTYLWTEIDFATPMYLLQTLFTKV